MGFFTGLSKVIHAGNAYMEHVRFVETARQTQPGELADLLVEYVQSLTQASFNGFKITLNLLANKEQNAERKELIQALLQSADAARTGNLTLSVADEPAAHSAPEVGPFERDVALVEKWYALNGPDQRADALKKHIHGMAGDELATFTLHLKRMRENVMSHKKEHEDNEDKAWGRFIEDQMAYRVARLQTGQRDPDFMRRLRELQEFLSFIEGLIQKMEALSRVNKDFSRILAAMTKQP
jgi:hypothetical protein